MNNTDFVIKRAMTQNMGDKKYRKISKIGKKSC